MASACQLTGVPFVSPEVLGAGVAAWLLDAMFARWWIEVRAEEHIQGSKEGNVSGLLRS
jgi:hypothetical protein